MEQTRVSAAELLAAFEVAERWLRANRDGINAINVYPVPDGDTGTNMLLTVRAALRDLPDAPASVGTLTAQIARGALMGARGNSGVIWSQMLRGFAERLAGLEDASAHDLIEALVNASSVAYGSVSEPVEGTMLTVLREAADTAMVASRSELDDTALFRALVDEAYASVERTPSLLTKLRDAGVVDSGGAGVAVLLEGVAAGLMRIPLPPLPRYSGTEQVATSAVEHEGHGYCTEFGVSVSTDAPEVDRSAMERELIAVGGQSVLVVGDARTVHVHVHMEDPGPALSIGARVGALLNVKVEDMQTQHEAWMSAKEDGSDRDTSTAPRDLPRLGIVAVAPGKGLARAFAELGATGVLEMDRKASAGELLEAARNTASEHVFVLPNDKDALLAAEAAAREEPDFLTVIPTSSPVAGLAAAIYYVADGDIQEIADQMREALEAVRCVEVSVSVRDATVDGVATRQGDAIAFVDGRLVAAAATPTDALIAALARAVDETTEIITVYLGAGVSEEDGAGVCALIEEAYPDIEVDVLEGGQSHYPYLVSVE